MTAAKFVIHEIQGYHRFIKFLMVLVGAAAVASAIRFILSASRAFARAIGTNDGDDRAPLNFECDAIERLRIAVKDIEIFHPQHQPSASAPR